MDWRALWNWLSSVLTAAIGAGIGWFVGWSVDNPPAWLPWTVGAVALVLLILWAVGAYLLFQRHRIWGARGKGGLVVLEDRPFMPEDGSFGWMVTVTSKDDTLECFRVIADEEIGKAKCHWEDSRGKKGTAHFAPHPKRRNVWLFCIPPHPDEANVTVAARVTLYSREKIRVGRVEPAEEPPGLMRTVHRTFLDLQRRESKSFSRDVPVGQGPKRPD